jgi:NAD(P)-dependent dehydrogenase (short-subunit alcohol dehydrogenase family)
LRFGFIRRGGRLVKGIQVTGELLQDKVAIVTGAAGGFGRVIAAALLQEGAKVCALDVTESGLAQLRDSLPSDHRTRLHCVLADIADYSACEGAVTGVFSKWGSVHILINNAALGMGIIRKDHMHNPVHIHEITPQMWQNFVAVNFTGAWNMTRVCAPKMLEQRWGRIIDITTSFFTMLRGGFQPYGPCKAGLEAMAAAHAQEFEGTGVTVNVVVPGGPANTPMVTEESGFDRNALVQPPVMAPPIVWLCSDAANGITGNRYVASHWDVAVPPVEAERKCRAPIAWPGLAQNPVWPGGKPPK